MCLKAGGLLLNEYRVSPVVRPTVGRSEASFPLVYALVAEDSTVEEVISPHSFRQASHHPDRVYIDQVIHKHINTDDPIPALHLVL